MTNVATWTTAAWLDAVTHFLDETLSEHGLERSGPVTQSRVRPWATLLEAPTSEGRVWLKAAGAGTAFEAALYAQLHAVAPERVLTPLGLDTERGWMVLPDGGTLLGHACDGDELAHALERVMPKYAELQLALMPQAPGLVSLGVTDMTPALMPTRFEQALEAVRSFLEREGSTSEWDEFTRVSALGPRYSAWCHELATAPGAPSLDHNDLHPWNIFASLPEPEANARFFDWGDSVLAHPFASLLVLLGALGQALEAPLGDRRLLRVRDAYLEAFGTIASRRELVRTADLACRVAKVARVLTWQRAIGNAPAPDYASIPFGKLIELLQEG